MKVEYAVPSRRSLWALDLLAFFLAHVQGGVGPFLAIYLHATRHWDSVNIGMALAMASLAGVIAQTPAGALVDRLRQKRELVALAALMCAAGCLATLWFWSVPGVMTAQALVGIVGAVFPPAVAGISLGLVGYRWLDRRIGRNESISHAGNVVVALSAGLLGHFVSQASIFYTVAVVSVVGALTVFVIRGDEIDYELARGGRHAGDGSANDEAVRNRRHAGPRVSGLSEVLTDRRILIFTVSAVLFNFANAAMLPLVGQRLSVGKPHSSSLLMAAGIIVAQLVMIPVAAVAGRLTAVWGRKSIFLIGFIALPIRGVLFTLSDQPTFIIAVQILDGVGAALFGLLSVLVVADLTKGTGHFNFIQGAIATAAGVGASLSMLLAGLIVEYAGYQAAFLSLAAIATVALLVFWALMPETKPAADRRQRRPGRGRSMFSGNKSCVEPRGMIGSEPIEILKRGRLCNRARTGEGGQDGDRNSHGEVKAGANHSCLQFNGG
jgi:MFS family permease